MSRTPRLQCNPALTLLHMKLPGSKRNCACNLRDFVTFSTPSLSWDVLCCESQQGSLQCCEGAVRTAKMHSNCYSKRLGRLQNRIPQKFLEFGIGGVGGETFEFSRVPELTPFYRDSVENHQCGGQSFRGASFGASSPPLAFGTF